MKNIQIVFEHSTGWAERCIQWFTQSEVDHVAVLYDSDDWDVPWRAEAATKGVRAVPNNPERKWKYVFDVKYDAKADVQAAQKYIGESYDFAGFFLFAWILLLWRLLKVKVRRPLHPTKGQFCSEFVANVLKPKVSEITNPQWTTPEDLLEICQVRVDLFKENSDACS